MASYELFAPPVSRFHSVCFQPIDEELASYYAAKEVVDSLFAEIYLELKRMQESEAMEKLMLSRSAAMEKLNRYSSEMRNPWMQEEFGVQFAPSNSMSATKLGAAAVKDAHYPCVDASEDLPSSEAEGEVKATWSSGMLLLMGPCSAYAVKIEFDRKVPVPLQAEECPYREYFLTSDDIGWKASDEGVYGLNKYQLGEGVNNTRFFFEAVKDMNGTIKRGIHAVATVCFVNTLQVQAAGAIAPEPAREGSMQAGDSKADTYNFWFNVVFCIGVLFGIIAVVVAIMQYRRSRRIQTVSAPTQQMLTMQRRSRVQYIIVEEETIHRIEDTA